MKKLYSDPSKDSQILAIHSLRQTGAKDDFYEWTTPELETLSCVTFSEEGYIRVYRPRENKLFESVMQLNINDRIIKAEECLRTNKVSNDKQFIFSS